MLRAERQKRIVELVNERGIVTLKELMKEVDISKATAHRDINELEQENLIVKTRGGAQSLSTLPKYEPAFSIKAQTNAAEKQRIAGEAVKYVFPGAHVFLDSGTTTFEVARLLAGFSDLTIVTNDIRIAYEMNNHSKNALILIGGIIRDGFCSSYGYYAENMLKNIKIDITFLSVDAIDLEQGVMSYTMDDVNLKSIGMENAKKSFMLCDHSKFTTQALFTVGLMDQITTIISGNELDPEIVEKIREKGKEMILV